MLITEALRDTNSPGRRQGNSSSQVAEGSSGLSSARRPYVAQGHSTLFCIATVLCVLEIPGEQMVGSATSAVSPWTRLNQAGIEAARIRNFPMTERCFRAAEKAAIENKDDYRCVLALINLAGLYALELKPSQQKDTLQRLIAYEQSHGEAYAIPRRWLQIARLEHERGEHGSCMSAIHQAIESSEKEFGANSFSTLQVVGDATQIVGASPEPASMALWEKLAYLQEQQHLQSKSVLLALSLIYSHQALSKPLESCARRLKPMLREGSPELAQLYLAEADVAVKTGNKEKAKESISLLCATIDLFANDKMEVKPSIKEDLAKKIGEYLGRSLIRCSFVTNDEIDSVFTRTIELSKGRSIGKNLIPGLYGAALITRGREREATELGRRFVIPELAGINPFASEAGVHICWLASTELAVQKNLPAAIRWAEKGVDAELALKGSAGYHKVQLGLLMHDLAGFYLENNQPAEAEKLSSECSKYLANEIPMHAIYGRLAEAQYRQGKYKQAELSYQLAIQSGAGSSYIETYRQGLAKCQAALARGT